MKYWLLNRDPCCYQVVAYEIIPSNIPLTTTVWALFFTAHMAGWNIHHFDGIFLAVIIVLTKGISNKKNTCPNLA